MSTAEKAEKEAAGHGAAWANLVACGGISLAVSLWHATHPEKDVHPNTFLAVLAAIAPVVTAAFASHNAAKKGAGQRKRVMTCIVFAMGMSLSVKAQAQSIGPIVGGTWLGVIFALMLDVSTFLALDSIMSTPAPNASAEASVAPPVQAPVRSPAAPPIGAPVAPPVDRLSAPRQAPALPPVQAPADRLKKTRKATAAKPKLTPAEVKAKAWELLKEDPEMSAPDLAVKLGKSPTSGHVRDMKRALLEEMRDAGDLPSVRSIGA